MLVSFLSPPSWGGASAFQHLTNCNINTELLDLLGTQPVNRTFTQRLTRLEQTARVLLLARVQTKGQIMRVRKALHSLGWTLIDLGWAIGTALRIHPPIA